MIELIRSKNSMIDKQRGIIFATVIAAIVIGFFLYFFYPLKKTKITQTTQQQSSVNLPGKAPRIVGYLHTQGTKIFDSSNNEILLQGVDDQRMALGNGTNSKCYSLADETTFNNISNWGLNFVRIAISWANIEPTAPLQGSDGSYTHSWNQVYLSQLDSIINGYKEKGIAVILDMHQVKWYPRAAPGKTCPEGIGMPPWLYTKFETAKVSKKETPRCDFFNDVQEPGVSIDQQDSFTAVWQMLTARYKNDPTVIGTDILNEPNVPSKDCPISPSVLSSFYNKVAAAIHKINPDLLLVFARYQDDTTPPPNATNNWIYTRHIYPTGWENNGLPLFQQAIQNSKNWNVPLWIGEFNGHNMNSASNKSADLSKMIQFVHDNNLNWSWWQYDQKDSDSLVSGKDQQPKQQFINLLQAGLGFAH